MLPFRQRLTPQQRRDECVRVVSRRPDHVPVIFERKSRDVPLIDREKYLVPPTLTGAQLQFVLRRRLALDPKHALFLHCHERLVSAHALVLDLYAQHKDAEDGFLYVTYATESAFG